MAYQLTNATSVEDLINKIAAFAVTAGWTERRNTLAGSLRTVTLQKSGDNINIYNLNTSGVYLRGAVGYDAGAAADSQPNQAGRRALANTGTGPFSNVFMFASNSPAEHVHVVVEIASGVFRHLTFGEVVKYGTWTGGTFFDAQFWDTASINANLWSYSGHHRLFDNGSDFSVDTKGGVRCDYDGSVNYFAPFGTYSSSTPTQIVSGGVGTALSSYNAENNNRLSNFYNRSINNLSGNTPLMPIQLRARRADDYWSPIGEVPGIRLLNMERFTPGDEFTVGPDTWKVFPWTRKGSGGSGQSYSLNFAFAYLKTP